MSLNIENIKISQLCHHDSEKNGLAHQNQTIHAERQCAGARSQFACNKTAV